MANKKKYYRSVVQIEILSEEPFEDGQSLEDIDYEITEGNNSGVVSMVKHNQELSGKEMSKKLKEQGSDPEFFHLDDDGEEVE